MIILKNTKNTQTFYVSKKCGIEPGQLPVGSYTKIEADERFQPKGNYGLATKDEVALKADKSELSNYVTTDAYNTKMTELDGEISAIQAQIGNISTTLDTINGEVI